MSRFNPCTTDETNDGVIIYNYFNEYTMYGIVRCQKQTRERHCSVRSLDNLLMTRYYFHHFYLIPTCMFNNSFLHRFDILKIYTTQIVYRYIIVPCTSFAVLPISFISDCYRYSVRTSLIYIKEYVNYLLFTLSNSSKCNFYLLLY